MKMLSRTQSSHREAGVNQPGMVAARSHPPSGAVGWAKPSDANASGGVPTIQFATFGNGDGGHGARAPLPTLRNSHAVLTTFRPGESTRAASTVPRPSPGSH